MKIYSKGELVEIAPGVRFVEQNHPFGNIYFLETISEVNILDMKFGENIHKQFEWKARNLNDGSIINYCITEHNESYGPTLFQTPEDAKNFWGI